MIQLPVQVVNYFVLSGGGGGWWWSVVQLSPGGDTNAAGTWWIWWWWWRRHLLDPNTGGKIIPHLELLSWGPWLVKHWYPPSGWRWWRWWWRWAVVSHGIRWWWERVCNLLVELVANWHNHPSPLIQDGTYAGGGGGGANGGGQVEQDHQLNLVALGAGKWN